MFQELENISSLCCEKFIPKKKGKKENGWQILSSAPSLRLELPPLSSPHLFLASFSASRFQHRTLAGLERGRKPPEPESLFIEGDKHFYGPLANYYFLQPPLLDLCRQHPSSTISLTFLLLFFHFCTFIFFSSHILFSFSGDESFSFSLFGEDKLKRKEISLNGTMEF